MPLPAIIPPLVLGLLGIGAVVYGVMVMLVGSGTFFHVVWFVIGAALVALAVLLGTGIWAALPRLVRRFAYALAGLVVAAILVSGGFVASGMGATAPQGLDYLVVLGAQVRADGPSTVLRHRLDAAYDYLVANPGTCVVVSGGQGPNEPWPEAQGMAAYLVGRGIDSSRIIEEPASTSTRQNLANSLALIERGFAGDSDTVDSPVSNAGGIAPVEKNATRVGIVTNDFHVYRAMRTARLLGYPDVYGIAAYSTSAYLPNNLLREALGLIKETLVG